MRTIVVANQKGGCGKTTIVINLAACLAREGQRTLAVDLDPQGHCALGLLVPEEQIELSIADVLLADGAESGPDLARVTWQISSHFDLMPSKIDLSKLEQKLAGVPGRELRLGRALQMVRDKYDFALIDTPPTVGFLTQSALNAADEVVVPVDTGYFALHGLSKQLDTIREMREATGRPLIVRILANLYDVRTKLAREILSELRKRHSDAMFTSYINFNTKLKESTSLGQPITEYDPTSTGCRDFVRFARELIAVGSGAVPSLSTMTSDDAAVAMEPYAPRSQVVARPVAPATMESMRSVSYPAASVPMAEPNPGIVQPAATKGALSDTERALLQRAEELAANASKLLATTETLIGPSRAQSAASKPFSMPTPEETERKIENFYGSRAIQHGAVFVVQAAGAANVRLAGDFNNWNPDRTPMMPSGDGSFSVRLPLGPGRYRYRYVVDGYWMRDPANERLEANPFGEMNSVVEVA